MIGLYRLLVDTAASYPEKLAIICGEVRLSYAQFRARVESLAQGLESLGIMKGDKIAVIHENCHRFLEAYFAAACKGAILVPVNTRLSPEDFVYILKDSQAKALIIQPCFIRWIVRKKQELPLLKVIILTEAQMEEECDMELQDYENLLKTSHSIKETSVQVEDTDIAQVYYTSGTTGRPKGVILTHRNNLVHAEGTIRELRLTGDDHWLHVSPMFHLADAWAVWSITQVGGTHVVIPRFEPKLVLETIQNHRITLSNFIPTMLNILVNLPGVKSHDFRSMRLILSGGAPIAEEVVRMVIDTFGCDYIQTYGLTETSPFLTMSILRDDMLSLPFEKRLRYMVTTGRAFHNVALKVVRDDGTEVRPDETEVGEIIAKGETVTPGYWGLSEETSRRIVDGWLHTRDLAVVNPEGYLTIVDRKDDMIITGGEKVYSIEVENVLYSHPQILEAAVIGVEDPVWGERVAAVVVKKDESLAKEDVVQFCRENLARFKVPKQVVFTNELPKTGSAKIYKYKLRRIYNKTKG